MATVRTNHVVLSTVGRVPLFAEEAQRRAAVRALCRVVDRDLVLFGLVDEHLHMVVRDEDQEPGRYAQALRLAWRALDGFVELQPTWIGEVESRSHAQSLLAYVLGQAAKHRLPVHPASWTGSCFAALVGAAAIDGFDPGRVALLLPRTTSDTVLAAVGLSTLEEPEDARLRALGAARIAEAAATAFYAPADLDGIADVTNRARAAAATLQAEVGLPAAETCFSLDVCARTARRLRKAAPEDAAIVRRALAIALAIEDGDEALRVSARTSARTPAITAR